MYILKVTMNLCLSINPNNYIPTYIHTYYVYIHTYTNTNFLCVCVFIRVRVHVRVRVRACTRALHNSMSKHDANPSPLTCRPRSGL